MNFWIYLAGMAIVIAGIAWGLSVIHVSSTYVMIICLILLGMGVMAGVKNMRQKDPPA
ncbi:MAG TPA: hypothetical protein VGQ30_04650 [Gemmatimonadaceae bacterium]|jgi:amino acid transporter|nr:hypothetical protein [Gemmatimonadaceae bacterium]